MAPPTPGQPDSEQSREDVLRLSAEQSQRFGVAGAPVLFDAPVYYPLIRMGVRPRAGSYETDCRLRVTGDGLATCTMTESGELVWSAHLDPPNQWKFSVVSFVFVRVADHTYSTRNGAFVANLSHGAATPVIGLFEMPHGLRQRRALRRVLETRQAGGPAAGAR